MVCVHPKHPRSGYFPENYGGAFGGVVFDYLLPISNGCCRKLTTQYDKCCIKNF